MRAALTRAEWRRVGAMAAVVVGLHAVGFFLLFALVVPSHLALGTGGAFGAGVGVTAYTLGMRHAFDADHIAAIDNTTRKMMAEGKRPLSVGFFFALGHSSVVFALAVGFAAGVRGIAAAVGDDGSALHQATGIVGPTVSGLFLVAIGLLNLTVLAHMVAIFRRMRTGEFDEAGLEEQLANRGLMNRIYGRAARAVRSPWQMYPLGMLFGLGFDTATEIALLATAGAAAAGGLPFYAILCLPLLFAAGMTLLDTLDGAFMNFAYGWALSKPVRRVFYNVTLTSLSVLLALTIGIVELTSVATAQLGLHGVPWDFVAGLDLNLVGYAMAAFFALAWLLALAVWRLGRVEERWSAALRSSEPA